LQRIFRARSNWVVGNKTPLDVVWPTWVGMIAGAVPAALQTSVLFCRGSRRVFSRYVGGGLALVPQRFMIVSRKYSSPSSTTIWPSASGVSGCRMWLRQGESIPCRGHEDYIGQNPEMYETLFQERARALVAVSRRGPASQPFAGQHGGDQVRESMDIVVDNQQSSGRRGHGVT